MQPAPPPSVIFEYFPARGEGPPPNTPIDPDVKVKVATGLNPLLYWDWHHAPRDMAEPYKNGFHSFDCDRHPELFDAKITRPCAFCGLRCGGTKAYETNAGDAICYDCVLGIRKPKK